MKRTITLLLCLLIVLPLGALILWKLTGGSLLSVQTNSMQPTFKAGDALLVAPRQLASIGQVISYRSSRDSGVIISHRIQKLQGRGYITEGDAMDQLDLPVQPYQVIGRLVAVLPLLGFLIQWLRTPVGLVTAVYVPAILIIAVQLRNLRL